MTDIEREINLVVGTLGLEGVTWNRVGRLQAKEVVRQAKEVFVRGDPRAWWLSLKHKPTVICYPKGDGVNHLLQHVPASEDWCWFVPETEEEQPPVFKVLVRDVPRVLAECQFFEYYLIGPGIDWLLMENDHNELLIVRRLSDESVSKSGLRYPLI